MKIFIPIFAAACLVSGGIGCGSDGGMVAPPASPGVPNPQSTTTSAVGSFPALTRPGTIYGEQGQVYGSDSASQGGLVSRYVLYGDGSFELQFMSGKHGFFSYAGKYTASGTALTLDFHDSDTVGPWIATAALNGDQLSVKYNLYMGLADFDDGVYVRVTPQ